MATSTTSSEVHAAVQRLVNGEPGNWRGYLNGFFDGKDPAAAERGAGALINIVTNGMCKPGGIPMLAEYVVDLAESRSLLNAAPGRVIVVEQMLIGVVRRVLSAAPNIGIREGYSREEISMLSELLHLKADQYVTGVRPEIACQTAEAVVYPGVWIDIVRQLGWTNAIGTVPNTELTQAGNPALVRLFREYCLQASGLYANRGQSGIAAALYTIAGQVRFRPYYERARKDDQAVPLNCVEMYETRGAPNWVPLTESAQRSREELYQELFAEDGAKHSDRTMREPHLRERFMLNDGGMIVLMNDAYASRVAERLLSHGLWNEAQRAMHAMSRSKGGQGRYIESIVLPAMYMAEYEGRLAVAAALGQIALASHQSAPRHGQNNDSYSMIVRVARSIAEHVFGERDHAIQSQIREYTDPLAEHDGFGGYLPIVPKDVPESLRGSERQLATERFDYETRLIGEILNAINRLFDTAIEQGTALFLDLF